MHAARQVLSVLAVSRLVPARFARAARARSSRPFQDRRHGRPRGRADRLERTCEAWPTRASPRVRQDRLRGHPADVIHEMRQAGVPRHRAAGEDALPGDPEDPRRPDPAQQGERGPQAVLGHLYTAQFVANRKSGKGFRCGERRREGCQSVYHLHLHVVGGQQLSWPPGC